MGFEQPPTARNAPSELKAAAEISISYGSTLASVATASQYWCNNLTCFRVSGRMASAGVGVGNSVAVGEDTTTVDVAGVSRVAQGVVTGKRCLSGAQAEERTRKKQMYKPLYLIM